MKVKQWIVIFLILTILLSETISECKKVSKKSNKGSKGKEVKKGKSDHDEEDEFSQKLIEKKLQKEEPWRWYHIVGIGIAILVGLRVLGACCGCCVLCCLGCLLTVFGINIDPERRRRANRGSTDSFAVSGSTVSS